MTTERQEVGHMRVTIRIEGRFLEIEEHCKSAHKGVVEAKKNNDLASDAIRGYLC
jgi:hypothetical protein